MDERARHEPASTPAEAAPSPAEAASTPAGTIATTSPIGTTPPIVRDPGTAAGVTPTPPVLPPPPFVVAGPGASDRRLAPLSPRVAVLIVAAIGTAMILWMARDAVRPFVVGLLIVYLLDPPVRFLSNRGVPRPLAILLVYVAVVLVVIEFLNLTLAPLVGEIQRFLADLPQLISQFEAQLARLREIYAGLNLPDGVREWVDGLIAGIGEGGAGVDPGIVVPVISGAGNIVGAIFGYILLPVWAFYLLKDRLQLTKAFDRSLPPAWRPDVWATIRLVERVFGQWIRGQILLGVTVGIATFAGLMLLNQFNPIFGQYAVLLSVIAGVLELLPIIGPIIAAVPAVLLAATAGIEPVIAALVLYTLIQQIENNVLVPKIQGDATELHPAAVMFALVIGGALAGLLGAILALPVTAALRDMVRYLFRRTGPQDDPASMGELARQLGVSGAPDTAPVAPGAVGRSGDG